MRHLTGDTILGTYLVLGGPHALGLLHLHWEAALVLFLYLILGNLYNNSFMLGRYFRSYTAHPLYTVLLLSCYSPAPFSVCPYSITLFEKHSLGLWFCF